MVRRGGERGLPLLDPSPPWDRKRRGLSARTPPGAPATPPPQHCVCSNGRLGAPSLRCKNGADFRAGKRDGNQGDKRDGRHCDPYFSGAKMALIFGTEIRAIFKAKKIIEGFLLD